MSHPFPTLKEQKQPHAWAIAPNASALKSLAEGIWDCAMQTKRRPLVVLSTAGPLMGVRAALEKYRPKDLPSHIAFLPQVMSFNDWLEAAPGAWRFPKKQTDLERWLSVYINLRKHKILQSWFKAESEAGAWGLAQAVIDACDLLSESVVPLMQGEINSLAQNQAMDTELWVKKVETLLDQAIAKAYVGLSRQVVDQESTVLLAFWRYLSSPGDPVMRKHLALAAHLQAASTNQSVARPLIWVETAGPKPIDQELMSRYLHEYSQCAPVINIGMDWHSVALWSEALAGQDAEGQLQAVDGEEQTLIDRNIQASFHDGWKLLAARRFEELAWAAAKSIEAHLVAGKTNIALVAQDRLAARRARALLSRFGPSLRIRDETGWKLSTTRAAASLNSWLELIRSPKEGPSASALLEFLQNPFFDLAHTLHKPSEACVSLVAQLEDILIASQAKSGWETFRIAIERANAYSSRGTVPHESLLELLTLLQRHHAQWLELKLDCENAYALLQSNLQSMGMAQELEKDSAGKQLLEVLKTFDLGAGAYRQISMRLPEWLSLLKTIIEEASYQEVGQQAEATLSILPLSSTRLREFDAVVLVGCDEQQLPAFSEPPLFFSDTLNRLLKASTLTAQYIQQARDLSQLLISCPQVDLLWQSKSKSGEPLRPSAWISRLRTQLLDWPILEAKPDTYSSLSDPLQEAVTTVSPDIALPISMSPSAYKALRDCPYRYYVRSILGLRKAKEFEEGFDASLAGQVLHALLKNFFQALKTEEQKPHSSIHQGEDARREWMREHLTKYSEKEFERLIKGDARVTGTLRDWQKQIPSFVEWQLQREAEGWQYHDAELPVGFMVTLTDPDGVQREIEIAGRADRFDINTNNSTVAAVIDYKNQGINKIKKRADHLLDDPQLLIYARAVNENAIAAHLPGRNIEQAEWVSLKADLKKAEDKIVRSYPVEQMPEMMAQFSEQLSDDLQVLWARKPMKAFAPDSVCQYCEARGICRKGMW
ncbi:PD-(D/E)XK nuclease family protein [Polynucleobacter sp. AP-Jannik-300A-C4]|uniref:PD-(D/E)XK nuclease family protein n=1 Tax=Polynucleobacter sp. AP-Jannik-300A-C4 TaxID=2576928 RepID=UPI001BFE7B89|nr:PD-(D/E)XK nuclease family protein [Polynucleobacter sp. AP-Jannik-300A-C4]QWE21837.1 PD-(D/E)XK nuclease family protein [Polynucleobacter sp. AP-Jannik-300A-C4]